MDQIIIFLNCRWWIYRKSSTLTDSDIIDNLNEMEWDSFLNTYIDKEIHNPPPVQINTGCMS